MSIFTAVRKLHEFDCRRKHVKKRNEIQNNRGIDQELIRTARRLVDLADQQNQSGNDGLHENRNVRRFPAPVNFPKRGWQVAIYADDKRYTRNPSYGTADTAGITHGDEHRCKNPEEPHFQHHGTDGNCMKNAAGYRYLTRRHEHQHRQRPSNVHRGNQHTRRVHRTRQSSLRIAHFATHRRNQFQPGKGKGNLRPEIDRVPVPCRHHVVQAEVRHRPLAQPEQTRYADQ